MNIFDDLLEELKEQNLIEETVIEKKKRIGNEVSNEKANSKADSTVPGDVVYMSPETTVDASHGDSDIVYNNQSTIDQSNSHEEDLENEKESQKETVDYAEPDEKNEVISAAMNNLFETGDLDESTSKLESLGANSSEHEESLAEKSETEFFRRRAMEEVTFLQMVEHVISGVEREQLKQVPKAYNDITVSQTLHSFLQIAKEGDKQKTAEAEFQLMQETQAWYFALTERDNLISVAALRRYCETARPVLSTQAVAALARFYRNAPFSESVRGKFDLVVTRLFSREAGNERRELLFSQEEIVSHLNELYADWRSIPTISKDEESEELLGALKFADFIEEARKADSFEDLARNDFFNRVRALKASIGDKFFSPFIVAAVIESNIKIGNRYVELIDLEREKNESDALWEKYGVVIDQALSESSSKTMQLVELLNERAEEATEPDNSKDKKQEKAPKKTKTKKGNTSSTKDFDLTARFGINKWLLTATVLTFLVTAGLYLYVEYFAPKMETSAKVQTVELENTSLRPYLKAAKIHEDTFYGFTEPAWTSLNTEKKQEILTLVLSIGKDKGYKKVQLMDAEGRNNGFASAERVVAEE